MNILNKTVAAVLLVMAATLTAQAQSFSYGITAGLNLSKLKLSGSAKSTLGSNISSDNRAGWFIGPKVEFNTVIGLGLDAALEYSQRKLNITNDISKTSESETYRTIEVPINLRYNIGFGKKLGVYIATGPQFGFALQNMKWGNLGTGNNFSKNNMNTTWNVGAGVRVLSHLEAGIGYNFALGKIGKSYVTEGTSDDYQLEYKTNTFQVQLTYLF